MATHESGDSGQPVPAHLPHPHHTADPAALEDPVHHDVAEHELDEEAASEDEADDDADDGTEDEADDEAEADTAEPRWPPAAEATGDEAVDAAAERLRELSGLPASEHVGVYEDVHRRLQDSLADLDGS